MPAPFRGGHLPYINTRRSHECSRRRRVPHLGGRSTSRRVTTLMGRPSSYSRQRFERRFDRIGFTMIDTYTYLSDPVAGVAHVACGSDARHVRLLRMLKHSAVEWLLKRAARIQQKADSRRLTQEEAEIQAEACWLPSAGRRTPATQYWHVYECRYCGKSEEIQHIRTSIWVARASAVASMASSCRSLASSTSLSIRPKVQRR